AHETCLLGDVAQVLAVAIAPRRRDCEVALVDAVRLSGLGDFGGGIHLERGYLGYRRLIVRDCSGLGSWELERLFEGVLHELGVACRKPVLCGQRLSRPTRGNVT